MGQYGGGVRLLYRESEDTALEGALKICQMFDILILLICLGLWGFLFCFGVVFFFF